MKVMRIFGTLLRQDCDHLRNHIAATLHGNEIADLQTEPFNFIRIVQGCPAYRGASDGHRSKFRHGS